MIVATVALAAAGCGAASRGPAATTRQLIERAEAAQLERRYDRARALYQQAKREAPSDVDRAVAAREYGRALLFWGEYDQALGELDAATRLDPDDAGTWHDLGMLRHHLGDVAGAEAAFERSITLRPADGRSRIALAALLWRAGRYRDALGHYESLRGVDLPDRVAARVEWAIRALRQRLGVE